MSGNWLRRNRWGLVLVVPAMVLALALPVHDAYGQFWKTAPRTAVTQGSSGWVAYDDATMRLTALTSVTHLTGFSDEAIAVPSGLEIFIASIEFQSTSPSKLVGCNMSMEDSTGATYATDMDIVSDLGVDVTFPSCTPDSIGKPPATWTAKVYFVAPAGARPVAVRIVIGKLLPKYARLTSR
jgi:hypothetical protein